METVVQASLTVPDSGGQIHMVLGITQETSKTSAQNKMQTPTQTLSVEGAASGDAGQSKLFLVDEDDDVDDDYFQIRPPCGCPVMIQ